MRRINDVTASRSTAVRTTPEQRIEDFTQRGWWGDKTLLHLFDQAVRQSPDHLALVDPPDRGDFTDGASQRLRFKELAAAANSLTAQFHAAGLRFDDIAVIQLPNIAELALVYLALSRLGVVVSPVPVQYGRFELGKCQTQLKPKAFVTLSNFKQKNFAADHAGAFEDDCTCFYFGDIAVEGAVSLRTDSIDAETQRQADAYTDTIDVSANDLFSICWTSGTTGQPKGVPRSHNHWIASATAAHDVAEMVDHKPLLNPFPMVNMASIGGFLFPWLMRHSTLVLHQPFDLPTFLQQIEKEQIDYTIAPPAVLTMLLKQRELLDSTDLSHLRCIGSGSAPLSPWMVAGFKEHYNIEVLNIFGSNEGMCLTSGPRDLPDPTERAQFFPRFGVPEFDWENRTSAMVRTRLIDLSDGSVINEPGKQGELEIWGATVFDGYWNSPDANAEVFSDDGYFKTGDVFEIAGADSQTRLYKFVGRCKDIIVRGGVKISPDEIDNLLAGHPKLAEAAVTGFDDEVLGERVGAVVVAKAGEDVTLEDVTGFLKEKELAVFKLPEQLRLVDELPHNATGKVLRRELRSLFLPAGKDGA